MILIILLTALAVLLTAGMIVWFAVDLKRAKQGEKSILWEEKNDVNKQF